MLNRNAEALFWVGRYMERAENHARLIDVHYHLQQEHHSADQETKGAQADKWARIVDALGSRSAYEQQYGQYNEEDVLHYITLDRDNPNSLVACINYARGNLRTLREKVPTELWDVVNSFYLWLRERHREELTKDSPHQLYKRIKEWTALYQGVAQSVMARENEWHFMECGRYLERAENTLRIMQAVRNTMVAGESAAPLTYPYLQAVLRSVSGYQVFRRYYADGMSPEGIIEFLVLHPAFPRSVRFALDAMDTHLRSLELQETGLKLGHGKIVRQTGKVLAELSCLEREDLQQDRDGLMLTVLLGACQQLGVVFAKTFFRVGEASA